MNKLSPDGPLRSTIERAPYVWMPHGVLRVAAYADREGFNSKIYDISSLRGSDDEIRKNFKKFKPDVVGLGGSLTHCYPNVKRISKILRDLYPDVWIITGAITASANVILAKTETVICVVMGNTFLEIIKLYKIKSK